MSGFGTCIGGCARASERVQLGLNLAATVLSEMPNGVLHPVVAREILKQAPGLQEQHSQ